jgi:colanic acid biosynthesis glycosyl transferase WcaI
VDSNVPLIREAPCHRKSPSQVRQPIAIRAKRGTHHWQMPGLKELITTTGSGREVPRPKVLFLNRSYWPDAEATGQLLTELCEDLAPSADVTVIAGQPNDNPTGAEYRRRGTDVRSGVRIRRVWHTRFPKRFLPGRIVNYLSFLVGASWAALWAKRPDLAVVETDPPLLCLIGWYLQRVRGAKLVIYLQDIHPDIGVALGKIPNGLLTRTLRWLMFRTYRNADRVVVLSRDMRQRVIDSGVAPERVVCIPNWIDTKQVTPVKLCNPFRERQQLNGEFVVMYSGNLGLCQRMEDVIAAAGNLRDRSDIKFLLIGGGSLEWRLKEQVLELGLPNVRFLPYQPKATLAESLSAADVHLVPLDSRVASCLMPSKLYGVLASGTPLVAIAPAECELAELTRNHDVGVVTPPGDPGKLAEAVATMANQPERRREMGASARRLAVAEYDRQRVTARFNALLIEVLGLHASLHCEAPSSLSAHAGEPVPVTAD